MTISFSILIVLLSNFRGFLDSTGDERLLVTDEDGVIARYVSLQMLLQIIPGSKSVTQIN